jgi:putative ABC transport system ATP-binding protein
VYELTSVTKSYPRRGGAVLAVRDVDLTVADGEWLAIQGRTGSGKTTLLQLLGAMQRPDRGAISLGGQDLARLPEPQLAGVRAATIGFVFQTFNLIPTLSARENVEAGLAPLHLAGGQRRQRTLAALDSVGLADRAHHLPLELSGGQQQRVGIARALAKEPNVLLADEPTGNLDTDTRDEIIALLEDLWRERGLTLVLVTHDSALAARAQRLATMKDGCLSLPPSQCRGLHCWAWLLASQFSSSSWSPLVVPSSWRQRPDSPLTI